MHVQIEILHDAQVIGSADLSRLDPPMGVAVGNLHPGVAYDRLRHATDIEDRENPCARAEKLSARTADGGTIDCMAITVGDYSDALGEIEVTVIGIPYPAYEAYFGDHPHYKDYYRTS